MAHRAAHIDESAQATYPIGTTIIRRGTWERIPWRGVFAGAFVAIAIQTVLMLLGIGIGLVSVDSLSNMDGVALGTGIWWLIAGTAAIFIGAWVAGRMTIPKDYVDGAITGAVTWALLTVASLWMATAATGAAVGGAYAVTTNAAQAMLGAEPNGRTGAPARSDDANWASLGTKVDQFLRGAGTQSDSSATPTRPGDVNQTAAAPNGREFSGRVRTYLESGSQSDRQAVVDYLSQNTRLTEREINSTLDEWQREYRQARENPEQTLARTAEEASDLFGEAALWTGFMLVLGLVAGCVGGAVGTPAGPAVVERVTPEGQARALDRD